MKQWYFSSSLSVFKFKQDNNNFKWIQTFLDFKYLDIFTSFIFLIWWQILLNPKTHNRPSWTKIQFGSWLSLQDKNNSLEYFPPLFHIHEFFQSLLEMWTLTAHKYTWDLCPVVLYSFKAILHQADFYKH